MEPELAQRRGGWPQGASAPRGGRQPARNPRGTLGGPIYPVYCKGLSNLTSECSLACLQYGLCIQDHDGKGREQGMLGFLGLRLKLDRHRAALQTETLYEARRPADRDSGPAPRVRLNFGTILGGFWDHFQTISGPFWDHFGDQFGIPYPYI